MFKRFRFTLGVLGVLILGLVLTACGDSPTAPSAPATTASSAVPTADLSGGATATTAAIPDSVMAAGTIKIRLSFPGAPETINGRLSKSFGDLVSKKTNNRVVFEYFPNSSVAGGDQLTAVNMVQSSKIEAVVSQASFFTTIDGQIEVLGYPFLFANHQSAVQFLNSDTGKQLVGSLEQYNFKTVSIIDQGFRQVSNSKRPVVTLADLAGLKVRIPQSNLYTKVFKALGAEPVTMNYSPELYKALQNKTLDGQDAPLSFSSTNKFQEVQNYITIMNYSWDPLMLNFSLSFWKTLPLDVQQTMTEAGNEINSTFNTSLESAEKAILDQFRSSGVQITVLNPEQRQAFIDATKPIYSSVETQYGKDFLNKVLKAAQS